MLDLLEDWNDSNLDSKKILFAFPPRRDKIEVKIWVVLCSSRNVLASVEHLQIWCPGSWDLVILNLAAKVASYTHWPIPLSSPLKFLMQIGQLPGSWIVLLWVDFMRWLILEHWSQGFPTRKWLCICWVMTSGRMGCESCTICDVEDPVN